MECGLDRNPIPLRLRASHLHVADVDDSRKLADAVKKQCQRMVPTAHFDTRRQLHKKLGGILLTSTRSPESEIETDARPEIIELLEKLRGFFFRWKLFLVFRELLFKFGIRPFELLEILNLFLVRVDLRIKLSDLDFQHIDIRLEGIIKKVPIPVANPDQENDQEQHLLLQGDRFE